MAEYWLRELFSTVLNMSLTAGAVILLVLAARLALRRAPKVFSYALWAVVLFRLVCPVSVTASFSLLGLVDAPVARGENGTSAVEYVRPEAVRPLPRTGTANPLPDGPDAVAPPVAAEPSAAPGAAASPVDPMAVLPYIWLAGVGAMAAYSAQSLLALRRRLVGAVRLEGEVWLADHIQSPFVMGVLRPRIYLPASLAEEERGYIILHERCHIGRLDHIMKLLAFAALCLHWFNPLVWAAFVLAGKDMEMSCDESVVKKLGPQVRADYSASLLSLATGRTVIAGAPLAFGEGNTGGRIRNLLRWKRPKTWVVLCAGLACGLVIAVCAANPAAEEAGDRTGSWANVEEFLRSEEPERVSFLTPVGESAEAKVLDVRIEDLTKLAAVTELAPEGTLELWSCGRLVRLDTEEVRETGDIARREDGWFDISGQGGCLIIALGYQDGSCDILRFDEASDGMFAGGGSYQSALQDWYVERYGLEVPLTGPRTLRTALNSLEERAPVQLSLTTGGETVGSYDDCWEVSNAVYLSRQLGGAEWTYLPWDELEVEGGGEVWVTLSELNGWSLSASPDSDQVCFVGPEGTYWFRSENAYSDLRGWFDEVEYSGRNGYDRQGSVVIPDRGQGPLAAAEEYCQLVERVSLSVTSGSKYCFTFVKTNVAMEPGVTEHLREWGDLDENSYAFRLNTVFVPENQSALEWNMAGNTDYYTGGDPDVPEGAFEYYRVGYVTLEEDGWHGGIVGTGW